MDKKLLEVLYLLTDMLIEFNSVMGLCALNGSHRTLFMLVKQNVQNVSI